MVWLEPLSLPPYGVRRHSGAATALWLAWRGSHPIPKRCRASLATALHMFGQRFGGGGMRSYGWIYIYPPLLERLHKAVTAPVTFGK
jgi:hypothetical protein